MAVKIGFGNSDITPPVGVELCGFGKYLGRRSTGVLENLKTRAMAWQSGERRGVLIACDLIGTEAGITKSVRDILADRLGIPRENALLASTHTHSGPSTVRLIGWGEKDPDYIASLPPRIAAAAVDAFDRMRDAEFAYGEAHVDGISYNRDGGDTTDHTVKLLKVISGGKCAGFLYNYSCHPVVMCEQTSLIGGDFVGAATNELSEKLGATGIFLQGSLGDQNSVYCHRPQDESVENLKKLASAFASAVERAYEASEPFEVGEINSKLKKIDLPQVPPDKIEIIRHLDFLDMAANEEEAVGGPPESKFKRHLRFEKDAYNEVLARFDNGPLDACAVEIQTLRIGDLYLMCHPCELYYCFHREIERRMAGSKVFVVGFANDYAGYIPSPDKFLLNRGREYSYAAYGIPLIRGEFRYADNAGGVLTDGLIEMARGMRP